MGPVDFVFVILYLSTKMAENFQKKAICILLTVHRGLLTLKILWRSFVEKNFKYVSQLIETTAAQRESLAQFLI